MQPTLCSRCHKNVAVIFIQKMEGGTTKSEGPLPQVREGNGHQARGRYDAEDGHQ